MQRFARNALVGLAVAMPGAAVAASPEAWDEFARDVEQKCSEAASQIFRRPRLAVDPVGTENYGVAVVYGRLKGGGKDRAAVICVLDKRTGEVELGSELGPDVIRVRRPKRDDDDAGQNADKATPGNDAADDSTGRQRNRNKNADQDMDDPDDTGMDGQ